RSSGSSRAIRSSSIWPARDDGGARSPANTSREAGANLPGNRRSRSGDIESTRAGEDGDGDDGPGDPNGAHPGSSEGTTSHPNDPLEDTRSTPNDPLE